MLPQVSLSLIFQTASWGQIYYPHYTEGKTEAQSRKAACNAHAPSWVPHRIRGWIWSLTSWVRILARRFPSWPGFPQCLYGSVSASLKWANDSIQLIELL